MRIKINATDVLMSKYVKLLAGGVCEWCGKTPDPMGYHNHHGVAGRRYKNTRWEPDNCVALCLSCHNFLSDFPKINTEFFIKRLGSDRVEQLEILARSQPLKRDEKQIRADLRVKIKGLE